MKTRLHPKLDIAIRLLNLSISALLFYDSIFNRFTLINILVTIIFSLFAIITLFNSRIWYDSHYLHINNIFKKGKIDLKKVESITKPFFFINKISFEGRTNFGSFVLINCDSRGFNIDNLRIAKFIVFMSKKFPEKMIFQEQAYKIAGK